MPDEFQVALGRLKNLGHILKGLRGFSPMTAESAVRMAHVWGKEIEEIHDQISSATHAVQHADL